MSGTFAVHVAFVQGIFKLSLSNAIPAYSELHLGLALQQVRTLGKQTIQNASLIGEELEDL